MKITIVMAVYEPNILWLREQLLSIETQTYRNIEVLAIDDASPSVPHAQISETFAACLQNTAYRLTRNAVNIGSNRVFGLLTQDASGDVISYCDQDDIWMPEKTERLLKALLETGASLVYSDLRVMDAEGRVTADSLLRVRRRLSHQQGNDLTKTLLFRNFTNGTAMMVPSAIAKGSLPFVTDMFADHWLTLYASTKGDITFVPVPLVDYRLHGNNQSAVMAGVQNKQDYLKIRIKPGISRFEQYKTRLSHIPSLTETIEDGFRWFLAREQWFKNRTNAREVWRYRHFGKHAALFELTAVCLPESVFMALVWLIRREVI